VSGAVLGSKEGSQASFGGISGDAIAVERDGGKDDLKGG